MILRAANTLLFAYVFQAFIPSAFSEESAKKTFQTLLQNAANEIADYGDCKLDESGKPTGRFGELVEYLERKEILGNIEHISEIFVRRSKVACEVEGLPTSLDQFNNSGIPESIESIAENLRIQKFQLIAKVKREFFALLLASMSYEIEKTLPTLLPEDMEQSTKVGKEGEFSKKYAGEYKKWCAGFVQNSAILTDCVFQNYLMKKYGETAFSLTKEEMSDPKILSCMRSWATKEKSLSADWFYATFKKKYKLLAETKMPKDRNEKVKNCEKGDIMSWTGGRFSHVAGVVETYPDEKSPISYRIFTMGGNESNRVTKQDRTSADNDGMHFNGCFSLWPELDEGSCSFP